MLPSMFFCEVTVIKTYENTGVLGSKNEVLNPIS